MNIHILIGLSMEHFLYMLRKWVNLISSYQALENHCNVSICEVIYILNTREYISRNNWVEFCSITTLDWHDQLNDPLTHISKGAALGTPATSANLLVPTRHFKGIINLSNKFIHNKSNILFKKFTLYLWI